MARRRTANPASKVGPSRAWWIGTGDEDCPHCEQTYSYEVGARCFECDAPICPMCIVRVEEHLVCPDCREATK